MRIRLAVLKKANIIPTDLLGLNILKIRGKLVKIGNDCGISFLHLCRIMIKIPTKVYNFRNGIS
jgi:hypothetical protein